MNKILVTGGAGFIGINFIIYWMKKYPEDKIVCFDLLTYASNFNEIEKMQKNNKRLTFIKGDICNRDLLISIFEKENFSMVINFAAQTHVDNSIDDSEIFLKTNLLGTHALLEVCKKYSVKRFHQISTDEVYGDLPLDNSVKPFTENSILNPSSPYSVSKAAADLLVLSYARTYKMPVSISRCSNNYGPYQHIEKFIPLMITKVLKKEKLPIYGKGENVRDWIYVEKHCEAIDYILSNDSTIGEVYNIGGGEEYNNLEVVKKILSYIGEGEDLISFVKDRLGHDLRYSLNCDKIKSQLSWENEPCFDYKLKKTIKWYKEEFVSEDYF